MSTEVLEKTERLVLKRTFRTSLDALWAAWTEKEKIEQWFGCADTAGVNATIDLRVGGSFSYEMNHAEGNCFAAGGTYTEVTPKTRLAYTWAWKGDPEMEFGETDVLLEFKEVGEGVELILTHSGFPTPELTGMHEHGWQGGLEKLAKLVEG